MRDSLWHALLLFLLAAAGAFIGAAGLSLSALFAPLLSPVQRRLHRAEEAAQRVHDAIVFAQDRSDELRMAEEFGLRTEMERVHALEDAKLREMGMHPTDRLSGAINPSGST